jgi:mannose-6-phosphate isomerase
MSAIQFPHGIVPLRGVIKDYAWGHPTWIAEMQGRTPTGKAEAELWLGTHPAGESQVPGDDGRTVPLSTYLRSTGSDDAGDLPFMLKLLAARQALSLQTHPNASQAQAGFAREETAGLARDSATRLYRDPNAKPEIICALTPFWALCGFRPQAEAVRTFKTLASAESANTSIAVRRFGTLAETLARGDYAKTLKLVMADLLQLPRNEQATFAAHLRSCIGPLNNAPEGKLVARLSCDYPDDAGLAVALLLNNVTLLPGEALYLDAGNLHAYVEGFGIEVMGNSDNVLRGGLTPKHIDVPELLKILAPTAAAVKLVATNVQISDGAKVTTYRTPTAPFELERIELEANATTTLTDKKPQVVVVLRGRVRTAIANEPRTVGSLSSGDSAFIHPNAQAVLRSTEEGAHVAVARAR